MDDGEPSTEVQSLAPNSAWPKRHDQSLDCSNARVIGEVVLVAHPNVHLVDAMVEIVATCVTVVAANQVVAFVHVSVHAVVK